jgi:hypothetical protein
VQEEADGDRVLPGQGFRPGSEALPVRFFIFCLGSVVYIEVSSPLRNLKVVRSNPARVLGGSY